MIRSIALVIFCSILIIIFSSYKGLSSESEVDRLTCTYQTKKLYGKVQVVDSFPDLKIKVVTSFPDLKVKLVTALPDKCGEWQIVESFPDLKVQFVESFQDIQIQLVESFPGI